MPVTLSNDTYIATAEPVHIDCDVCNAVCYCKLSDTDNSSAFVTANEHARKPVRIVRMHGSAR